MVFWCPYFESRFPTVVFEISEMPIDLLGVGTDPLPGRFQLPTPNKSIGTSEVARDGFKVGCFRLPLVGGTGFLKRTGNKPENCGFLINDCTAPLTVIVVVTVMVRVLEWH